MRRQDATATLPLILRQRRVGADGLLERDGRTIVGVILVLDVSTSPIASIKLGVRVNPGCDPDQLFLREIDVGVAFDRLFDHLLHARPFGRRHDFSLGQDRHQRAVVRSERLGADRRDVARLRVVLADVRHVLLMHAAEVALGELLERLAEQTGAGIIALL